MQAAMLGFGLCLGSLFGWQSAAAAPDMHVGKVVSVLNSTLVMTDENGKSQHSHVIPKEAVVTLNGKPAKLEQLTMGDMVKITTHTRDGKTTVKEVEAKSAPDKSDDVPVADLE